MAKSKTWYGYWLGSPRRCSVYGQSSQRDQAFLKEYDGLLDFSLGAVEAKSVEVALEEVKTGQWQPASLKTPWYGFWIGEDHLSIYAAYATAAERDTDFAQRYDGVSEYLVGIVPAGNLEEALELVEADKWIGYTQRT